MLCHFRLISRNEILSIGLGGFIDIMNVNYRLFVKPAPTSILINLPNSILKVRKQYIQIKKEYLNLNSVEPFN
jgi:hypothetical protein